MKMKSPQAIMILFLGVLFVAAKWIHLDIFYYLNKSFYKFVMNGVLVLSMIPMINTGVGLNFGLPVGIISGLVSMCIIVNLKLTGLVAFIGAILLTIPISILFGLAYGYLLNRVKGKEDIAAIMIGLSLIPIMNFFWTVAPFTNRQMLYPIGGIGLRPKIGLEPYFANVLDHLYVLQIGKLTLPLGLLCFYGLICFLMYLLFQSKLGDQMIATGENKEFCILNGINIDKTRIIAVIISTFTAGVGICVYAQSYGFIELYDSPSGFTFPAVSAILIGGCMGNRATIPQAILGTYLYHSIYLLSAPIFNELLIPEMSEILRMIITNGIILYALLVKERGTRGKLCTNS